MRLGTERLDSREMERGARRSRELVGKSGVDTMLSSGSRIVVEGRVSKNRRPGCGEFGLFLFCK